MTRAAASGGRPRRVFWKEIFAKFVRKPLKQCKTCSSAARDTWKMAAAWPCVKQRHHLLLQGLHPSRSGRRWFSGGPQVGEDSDRRGSWMPARSRSQGQLGQVATPCHSGCLYSDHVEIRIQGLAWRRRRPESGNSNWTQAAEAWSSLPN